MPSLSIYATQIVAPPSIRLPSAYDMVQRTWYTSLVMAIKSRESCAHAPPLDAYYYIKIVANIDWKQVW